jgi:uncharacterized membrane protein
MEAPVLKNMWKDPRTRVFLIHFAVFAVAVVILAAINYLAAPTNLWFIWVLAGWGIGVAAHGLAVWLCTAHRRERVFVDPKARAFTVHLFAYLAVVALLFVANLLTDKWWFYWVALGWGAGVLAHGLVAFRHRAPTPSPRKDSSTPAKTTRANPSTRSKPRSPKPRAGKRG